MLNTIEKQCASKSDIGSDLDLYPYIAELLEGAPQSVLDFLTEDLERYERTGYQSTTISSFLRRARCLADADLITRKLAA